MRQGQWRIDVCQRPTRRRRSPTSARVAQEAAPPTNQRTPPGRPRGALWRHQDRVRGKERRQHYEHVLGWEEHHGPPRDGTRHDGDAQNVKTEPSASRVTKELAEWLKASDFTFCCRPRGIDV
jgi:hypothetical protein